MTCGQVRWMPLGIVEPWKFTMRWWRAVDSSTSSYQRIRSWDSESMKSIFTPLTPHRASVESHFSRSTGSVSRL